MKKQFFIQGPSRTTRLALLFLASVTLMTLDHREHHLESIRATLSLAVYPMQYLVNLPFAVGGWASENLALRTTLLAENAALKEKQQLQEVKLQKLESLERENQRLRSLLQSASRDWEQVLIAELMEVDSDPFRRQFQINRGSRDGVFDGHPLLDAHGIVGQVIHVSPLSSTAIMITDPSHAIPVRVSRNGLRAIALGTGDNDRLEIPHIPNNADIREGDLLVTSGLGLRFPPGYPVAVISEITLDPAQPYAQVVATPTAQLDTFHEVLLVWPESRAPAAKGAEEGS